MQCFMCGTHAGNEDVCPKCGANILLYRQILYFSEQFYNQGLDKAKVRDLSGAEEALKRSLSYSKYNIPARNLLGLIYYETGEIVKAINEWVVVKNYDPDNEMANRYLAEIENTPGLMNRINTTIKKYNQALDYCIHGSTDLAMIQLKKILSTNSHLVKAYQLLALIYIKEERYNEARKQLIEANKIDNNNTITLLYLQEVKDQLKDSFNKHRKKKNDNIGYDSGDVAVFSQDSFRSMLDGTRAGIMNVLLGLVMGLLICFFMVVPSIKQESGETEGKSILAVTEDLSKTRIKVDELQSEVDILNSQLDRYTGQKDVVECYEILIEAIGALNAGDRDSAKESAQTVNRELLADKGIEAYDEIMSDLSPDICEDFFTEGKAFYEKKNFESAINNFRSVIEIKEDYEDGYAMYLLADSLRQTSEIEEAADYYAIVVEKFPNTNWGRSAAEYLNVVAN